MDIGVVWVSGVGMKVKTALFFTRVLGQQVPDVWAAVCQSDEGCQGNGSRWERLDGNAW